MRLEALPAIPYPLPCASIVFEALRSASIEAACFQAMTGWGMGRSAYTCSDPANMPSPSIAGASANDRV